MSIAASSSRISAFQPIDFRPRRRSWTPRTSTPSTIVSCAAASAWNGIKGSGVVNFYELLSLDSQNVGLEEIKRAYRSKAREWHPDVCPPSRKEESTRLFVELQRAYQTLSDPVSRSKYDRELSGLKLNHDHDEMWRKKCDGGAGVGSEHWREVWEDQLAQLKLRSDRRMKQRTGSWSSRMRSQRP